MDLVQPELGKRTLKPNEYGAYLEGRGYFRLKAITVAELSGLYSRAGLIKETPIYLVDGKATGTVYFSYLY